VGGWRLWREGADSGEHEARNHVSDAELEPNEVSPEEGVKREMINSGQTRGRERAKKDKSAKFTVLLHHVTP
jgi:hypothetical protein